VDFAHVDDAYRTKKRFRGAGLSVPFHQEEYREQQLGGDELLKLSAEGDMRSRRRLLAMLVSAAALWLLIYAMARLLFH
jgi:hypothetical protein